MFTKYFSNVLSRFLSCVVVVMFSNSVNGQRTYTATNYDYIFSLSQTTAADSIDIKNQVRFSGWLNYGLQLHHDFTNNIGVYSGVQLRNVGMINKIDTLQIKHRAYALGVPLALKIGNIDSKWFLEPGAEVELMFNYKVKEFIRGRKVYKQDEWMSDKVNLINPSIFLQVSLGGFGNIKLKYYLLDFLKPAESSGSYKVHVKGGSSIPGYTGESKLFYISYGATFINKKRLRKNKNDETPPPPSRTENRRRDA